MEEINRISLVFATRLRILLFRFFSNEQNGKIVFSLAAAEYYCFLLLIVLLPEFFVFILLISFRLASVWCRCSGSTQTGRFVWRPWRTWSTPKTAFTGCTRWCRSMVWYRPFACTVFYFVLVKC